jgi:hypothetical protein
MNYKNKERKEEILREMITIKGGDFKKWYDGLSDEDRLIYRECLEWLNFNKYETRNISNT